MMALEMSIRPCVCDISGDRFSVQFRNSARRSEKSHVSAAEAALPASFPSMPPHFLVTRTGTSVSVRIPTSAVKGTVADTRRAGHLGSDIPAREYQAGC